jgi:DNA polymerase III epsilon subunit-like protein
MKLLFENWRKYLGEAIGDLGKDTWEPTKAPVSIASGLDKVEKYKDKTWVFFDTETTGFGSKRNAITEIAGIAVEPNLWDSTPVVVKTFSQKAKLTPYVKGRDPESESGKVTKMVLGMTRYGEKDAPEGRFIPEKEMIEKFYDWLESLGNVVLVIQNARFDMNMLSVRYNADPDTGIATGAGSVGKQLPRYPIIDTVPIIRKYLIPFFKTKAEAGNKEAQLFLSKLIGKKGKKDSASQGPVASAFGIPIIGWHAAIDDVKMLMQIFQKAVDTMRRGGDIDIRGEFEKVTKKPLTRHQKLKRLRKKQKRRKTLPKE